MVKALPGRLSSVDNALRVLELLSRCDGLRVIDVADHLGVAPSTAHRILSSLLARGFLVQDSHKVYFAGPAIERFRQGSLRSTINRELLHPYLEQLASTVGETCHIAKLEGTSTRFIDSVESARALRVGNRTGMLLPAVKTAIGVVLLAELPSSTLRTMYPRGLTGDAREAKQTLQVLERRIRSVRRSGYALNLGESDAGISAVGTCLREPSGRAFAGIAVAVPTPRFERRDVSELVEAMGVTVDAITRALTPVGGSLTSASVS